MSLFEQIKHDRLQARKQRDSFKSAFYSTLVGEIENYQLREGIKVVEDSVVQEVVRKFVKNQKDVLAAVQDKETITQAIKQLEMLAWYLPAQMTDVELQQVITEIHQTGATTIKQFMQELEAKFSGTYDRGIASKLIKETLAAK